MGAAGHPRKFRGRNRSGREPAFCGQIEERLAHRRGRAQRIRGLARPSGPLRALGAALVLIALCVAAYLPSLPGEFLWDDDSYVTVWGGYSVPPY